MNSILNVGPKFNSRIKDDFCPDCKFRRKCQDAGRLFKAGNGVCLAFEWVSEKRKQEYEKEVQQSKLETALIKKGKTIQETVSVSPAPRSDVPLHSSVTPPANKKENKHYFYCRKDKKEVVYTRSTLSKSYAAEVVSFRKYLSKNNIEIIREEIK